MNDIKVLSLFDGISCGQLALRNLGYNPQYFASEIYSKAIHVTQKHFPNTIQLGDVKYINGVSLKNIDLLMGGSPCQGFSRLGNQEGFEDKRSILYFEFLRILEESKPKYFLLENVPMKQEWLDKISSDLGVKPYKINSSLVSAQNRKRYYWTNIPMDSLPQNMGIKLRDILEENPDEKYNLSKKALRLMGEIVNGVPRWKKHPNHLDGKGGTVTASYKKGAPNGVIWDLKRRLTPLECERLQTIPDNYTEGIAMTNRYKVIGDAWTVKIIEHILKGMK